MVVHRKNLYLVRHLHLLHPFCSDRVCPASTQPPSASILNLGGDYQVDFRADTGGTPNIQIAIDFVCTFANPGQSPMPTLAIGNYCLIDPAPIVAYSQSHRGKIISDLDFYFGSIRVLKGVYKRFSSDAVYLVERDRIQRSRRTQNGDGERNARVLRELLTTRG